MLFIKPLLSLVSELSVFIFACVVIRKQPSFSFLKPLAVLAMLGAVVEFASILSLPAPRLLPRTTNYYTYPVLTLIEFWGIVWIAWRFTTERKEIVISGVIFTVLWVAAKLSIEPFYLFDSTTFALLNLATLVIVGSVGRKFTESVYGSHNYRSVMWIFTGFVIYSFLGLTTPIVTNFLDTATRSKLWWVNDFAFYIKTCCTLWGLRCVLYSHDVQIDPPISRNNDFAALSIVMPCLFIARVIFFTEADYAGVMLIVGLLAAMYYGYTIGRIGIQKYIKEQAEKAVLGIVLQKTNTSTEAVTDDIATSIALISNILNDDAESLQNEPKQAVESLKSKLNPHIERIVLACARLLQQISRGK